jgi:glucose-1-phosphate adenylyltransferase
MGIDVLEDRNSHAENLRLGRPALGIGERSVIEGAIIDKNARIGRNVRVTNQRGTADSEEQPTHVIRDGVVVIPKAAILKDGTVI